MPGRRPPQINLRDLVHDAAVTAALPTVTMEIAVEHFFSAIAKGLLAGKRVDIHNFGYFELRLCNRPDTRTIRFQARKRLRDYVSAPLRIKREL